MTEPIEKCECGMDAEDCSKWNQGIRGHGFVTDPRIEQKAREVVENILNFAEKLSGKPLNFRLLINIKTGEHYDGQDRMNGYVAAALQSAVADVWEEAAKEVNAELESIKDEDAEIRAIQRLLKVRTRIRARGQKETVCNCPQLNGPDANQHDMECPDYRRPHKETA